ncbi:MAG: cytochrome [Caulobacter sp.]|nr:cytochrome [Caulobacter sp.]
MADASTRPISEFSFLDPKVQDDPFDFYRALHAQAPVYQMPETGMYMVSRYDDLREMLMDTATFSNRIEVKVLQGDNWQIYEDIIAEKGWPEVYTLNFADPPAHTRYRRIADKIFNARRIEAIAPRITEIVAEIIDRFIDRGECEVVSEFAFPLVGTVISEQLGLDPSKMDIYKRWGDAIMLPGARILTPDEIRENAETILEMQHYVAGQLEARRKDPRNDLISAVVQESDADVEPLDMAEMQSLMRQFLSGTYESLVSAICHGLWLLTRFPDQMEKLRADPSRVKDFVEEALRFETPVPGLARIATRDTEIAGVAIPKGSLVMPRYAAANHDAAKFECPHKMDIDRKDKHHMAFGAGPHLCVGRVLARREMIAVFGAVLARMGNIGLARPLPDPVHVPHMMLRPMRELHIRFDRIG